MMDRVPAASTAPVDDDLDLRLHELHQRYRRANPTSEALHHRAAAVLPGGSTRSVLDMGPRSRSRSPPTPTSPGSPS